jgi:hypothetical protein
MPEDYDWKERRDQVERYRILAQETTDPIAARLLHDIVLDLEAELEGSPQRWTLMLHEICQRGGPARWASLIVADNFRQTARPKRYNRTG